MSSAPVGHPAPDTTALPTASGVRVRLAHPEEYEAVGALTVDAYAGLAADDDAYRRELADARHRAAHTELLVAVTAGKGAGHDTLLGTVAFVLPGSDYAEVAREGEAEFRMLAVAPAARGLGVGETLVRACLERARRRRCARVVISTVWDMRAAHRLYARLGFHRAPDRDWYPEPDIELICYTRELD